MSSEADLLAWLRRARKGVGIQAHLDDMPLDRFYVGSAFGLMLLVDTAIDAMSNHEEKLAVHNALGMPRLITGPNEPLTLLKDRRERFARSQGLSVRTVMRLEERGLAELVTRIEDEVKRRDSVNTLERIYQDLMILNAAKDERVPAAQLAEANRLVLEMMQAVQTGTGS